MGLAEAGKLPASHFRLSLLNPRVLHCLPVRVSERAMSGSPTRLQLKPHEHRCSGV